MAERENDAMEFKLKAKGEYETEQPPEAEILGQDQRLGHRLRTRLWWLTGLCGLLAVGLAALSWGQSGLMIHVSFSDGHGLKAGDTLRYRGVDVGEITQVQVGEQLQSVRVTIRLEPGNESLAVEGSQFWIERPSLRLGQIRGLDTVVGAKYVGILPGDLSGDRQVEFEGRETPLVITDGKALDIRIRFPDGEGLVVGDPVRYRGISVGEVTGVDLSVDVSSVQVNVRLVGTARDLARAGTQFWIERPRLDLTEVRGLETIIGGRYLAIQPTQQETPQQTEFVGLAAAPPLSRREGSLEIELDAATRMGLVRGAPVTYRGLEVGRVANVNLSSDGASVKVAVIVDADYADLVRANSKWWVVRGAEFDLSLQGIHLAIDSLSSWLRGGVAFATPETPGKRVVTGHRYMLESEPQPEWLDWQPRIATGQFRNWRDGGELPKPIRVVASWRAALLGLYRRNTVETWAAVRQGNSVYVPASFVRKAAAGGDDVMLEVAGESASFDPDQAELSGLLSTIELPVGAEVNAWPEGQIQGTWDGQSTLLITNPELQEPIAIDATRLSRESESMLRLAPGVPIAPSLHGSSVIDAESARLVGLLVESKSGWLIGLIGE